MPPFSPENSIHKADNTSISSIRRRGRMNDTSSGSSSSSSNDSHDVPFKPLMVLELSSTASYSTLATASTTSNSSSSSLSSFASSASSSFRQPSNNNNKMKRNVSFREDADVRTVEPVNHPQDISDRWYSKRELHIIRHKIRSLLRWVNMRNQHFFQYEQDQQQQQQQEVEYYDDDDSSLERYLRTVPPPPQPPCVTFYDECLFGLEKHLFVEKNQVRETKYNAQSAVFSEQQLQKQLGQPFDHDRLAFQYSQTSAASQQEAIWIAQINAQESLLHGQELEAQQQFEQEQRLQIQQLERERELEIRKIESLETAFLQEPSQAHQHLFLLEKPCNNNKNKNNPFNIFQNWRACFGKLFRPHQDCEIDSDEDCLNAPPRQPQRHPCLNVQQQQEDYYYR